ncbi:MAG: NADH-quinone oxidoreductase subunit N [Deltaproteobacteria bacterium]|jgi:NADH-quinone oxidoreductase subunit N|nr:NADH-quinone oxidoreductase subunit N [Deltaproteobacteria bacterium]
MKWLIFSPEIYYLLVSLWFLALSMLRRVDSRRDYFSALLLAAGGVLVCLLAVRSEGLLFSSAYQVDLFSQVFKVLLALGLFLIVCLCPNVSGIREKYHSDFYLLLFVCTLAMLMLVSSVHLLAMYVSLELSSYALYILVALRREKDPAIEAGIKYFLIGITASAVMLFGLALLYATTQVAHVDDMLRVIPAVIDQPVVILGLLLTLSGFFFKLAVFPFHFWAPDVYQGATNQVTAYIATASKVAAIALLIRMVAAAGSGAAGSYLAHALVTLAIVSMTVGNLAAIVQQDIKRLLAYSTVAHAGYLLIGILSMNPDGYGSVIFYAGALLIMKFSAFLVVVKVADDGRNIQIKELAGLHQRSPLLAMTLMVSVFSLAGIPPTIGFSAKLFVFLAAMQQGYFTLVLIAMINVLISLYYYLLVLKAAYLLKPDTVQPDLQLSPPLKLLTGLLILAMVGLGMYPTFLLELAEACVHALL